MAGKSDEPVLCQTVSLLRHSCFPAAHRVWSGEAISFRCPTSACRDNLQLEKTSDREGFKDSPCYRNFYKMLMEFHRFSSEAQEFFGRSWSDFAKARREQLARVDTRKDIEDISRDIRDAVRGAPDQETAVQKFLVRLASSLEKSQVVAGKLADTEHVTPALQRQPVSIHNRVGVNRH